jgi:hypothetical protein
MTVKYKARSFLQRIGRITGVAKNSGKRQRSFDLDDDLRPARRVKVGADRDVMGLTGLVENVEPLNVADGLIKSE